MPTPETSLALIPKTVDETVKICEMYAQSALIPQELKAKTSKADIFLAVTYGMDLGFSPAASLRAVCVIKGKPGLYADAMVALVMASGKAKFFRSVGEPGRAEYETCRVGEKKHQKKSFSSDDAKKAGLTGGNWQKYHQHMLEARAKSWLARDCYPDVLHGVYSQEELQDVDDGPSGFEPIDVTPEPIVPREDVVVDAKEMTIAPKEPALSPEDFAIEEPEPEGDPSKPTLLEELESAPDVPTLRAIGVRCADVVDVEERNALRGAFTSRLKELQ